MKISDGEFQSLLETFATRIWYIQHCFDLYLCIKNLPENVLIQHRRVFFTLSECLHKSTISSLYTLGDDKHSVSVRKFLNYIKDNLHIFSLESWEQRVGDRKNKPPNQKNLPDWFFNCIQFHPTSVKEIEDDINFLSNHTTINKIHPIRGNVLGHTSKEWLLGDPCGITYISDEEILSLIKDLVKIVNKYYHRYSSTEISTNCKPSIKDDFKAVQNILEEYWVNYKNMNTELK